MRRPRHAGHSLVELMVGVALALFITAVGSTLFIGQLRENRALTLEARLAHDLRVAADAIARDLRRAGYWGAADHGANPYAALTTSADAIDLRYSRDEAENGSVDPNEQFGFRLRNGAIEFQLGADNWQALTDSTTLTVTGFSVIPESREFDLAASCASSCTGGACPRQQRRTVGVTITAALVADRHTTRTVQRRTQVRSDAITGACS